MIILRSLLEKLGVYSFSFLSSSFYVECGPNGKGPNDRLNQEVEVIG